MIDEINDSPERGRSQFWLDLITESEAALDQWQSISDNIDKAYADLSTLNGIRDREFQLFWSNIQVMCPSIYARPPVPVVTPKFKDRRPLYRTASEMLERACVVSFDMADIDQTMIGLRDDLAIVGRATAWVRYESDDGDKVCYDHVDRKDFAHTATRKWSEVDMVARRAWLTPKEMKDRFTAEIADEVNYQQIQDGTHREGKACGVWEVWCKSENRVAWVTEGYEHTLDEGEPYLKLEGFFPCPRPAFATVQRRSLIPVPDMVLYKDQLEEVNDLTRRIHILADAIKVRGFYAGGGDVGAAIETAIKMEDDSQILIPIPAMQSLMQGGGDPIMWLPIDTIAATITGLIELRRQVIDDVYQIIGLSDIMRGATEAGETLGAQRLKQQNGSHRVRDKQNELVRIARDLVRIGAEIMSEEFSKDTLTDMAQMDLPTAADIKKQIKGMESSAEEELRAMFEQAEQGMEQSQGQMDPEQAQQELFEAQRGIIDKWQGQITEASNAVTIEAVTDFLADEKMRPFSLDIETDSTIYPDEMAEKQSRQEFMAAFAGSMQSLAPMFQMGPEAISVAGGVFKFALSPYRVGRELEGLIDDFVDQAPDIAERLQNEGEDGGLAEAQKALADAEMVKAQAAMEGVQARAAKDQAENERKIGELQMKAGEAQSKSSLAQQKAEMEIADLQGKLGETDARIDKMRAETAKILDSIGLDARKQELDEYKAKDATEAQDFKQAVTVYDKQRAALEPQQPPQRGSIK